MTIHVRTTRHWAEWPTSQPMRVISIQRLTPLLPARSASCRWRAEDGLQWPVRHQMWGSAGARGISLLHPFPASYIVEILLFDTQLNELLAAARCGRAPSRISVDVEGMEYDWQPDGSGKKWDNKASPHLRIVSARFTVPVVSPVTSNELERDPAEKIMPPTRLQLDQLSQRVDKLIAETKVGLRSLMWAAIVVGVLLLILK